MAEEEAQQEMSLVPLAPGMTFVYPRNRVAHPALLSELGIMGYRSARPFGSRLASFASEFNVFARPDRDSPTADPIAIPAGYFVNWRSGPRRLVPTTVSRVRAQQLLEHAARTGAVVHYWMYPENLASALKTIRLLRAILHEVRRLRELGRLVVMTQRRYCLPLRESAAPGDEVRAGHRPAS